MRVVSDMLNLTSSTTAILKNGYFQRIFVYSAYWDYFQQRSLVEQSVKVDLLLGSCSMNLESLETRRIFSVNSCISFQNLRCRRAYNSASSQSLIFSSLVSSISSTQFRKSALSQQLFQLPDSRDYARTKKYAKMDFLDKGNTF